MGNSTLINGKIRVLLICEVVVIFAIGGLIFINLPNKDFILGGLVLLNILLFWRILALFYRRIRAVFVATQQLAEDELQAPIPVDAEDIFGFTLKNINKIVYKIAQATEYIHNIGKESSASDVLLEDDRLGLALAGMSKKMQQIEEEEKKRTWVVEGLAKFSKILRSDSNNMQDLSFQVISNLAKYVGANQGGFFIEQEDESGASYLELMAAYAYEKRKFLEKKVQPGQGLLGQCILEKETIYHTVVPENYVHITSGLGNAPPRNLVIIPLMVNDRVYGAVELASFHKLASYQIEFLEKVAENIAATVASVKANANTQQLLEDSQKLTTELQSREEEMRQSMEELSATQEEMQRKQVELDSVVQAIDATLLTAEFDRAGNLTKANVALQKLFGGDENTLKTQSYLLFIGEEKASFWNQLKENINYSGDFQTRTLKGRDLWLNASFTPVSSIHGRVEKVLMLAQDITGKKAQEIEFQMLSLVADNTDNSVIITNKTGHVEYVNEGFVKMTGYTFKEIVGKKPGQVLQGPATNPETISRLRQNLLVGAPIYEEILNYNKAGDSYWVSLVINPVKNEQGEIDSFISVQANITETKRQSLDFAYKMEAISKSNAIIELDMKGKIIEANENFLKIIGYDRKEMLNLHHDTLLSKQEQESSAYKGFWEKISKGVSVDRELILMAKNKSEVWIRIIYNPILDMNGKPNKIVAFAVDITEENKLRLETLKQEAELKSHMVAINKTIASVAFDMEGGILEVNDIFLGVTGFTKDELIDKHFDYLLTEEEKAKPQTQMMWENLAKGQTFSGEFKNVDKEGKEMWLTGTYNPIFDREGIPYKVMMFAQFTTKEKEKQKDLIGTLQALINSVPVMEINVEGKVKTANDIFLNLFGYRRMELISKEVGLVLPPSSQREVKKILPQLIEQLDFVERNLDFVTVQGETKLFRATFTAIKNLENQVYKIIILLLDPS